MRGLAAALDGLDAFGVRELCRARGIDVLAAGGVGVMVASCDDQALMAVVRQLCDERDGDDDDDDDDDDLDGDE